MMTTSTTMAINVGIDKACPDPAKDFAPVALVSGMPFILVGNPSLPVMARRPHDAGGRGQPGGLNYVSTGQANRQHLPVLLNNVGSIYGSSHFYKGNAPGLQDVVAGHVSVMFSDLLSALPLVRSGKLRALGLSTKQRSAAAPDIAPLAEAGVPGYDASAWQMIVAPAATPKAIVGKLNSELHAIESEPETSREINDRGTIAIATPPPEELQRFVNAEIERWRKVVAQAGATGSE